MKNISMHKLFFASIIILVILFTNFAMTDAKIKLAETIKIENSVRNHKYENTYNIFINELNNKVSSEILKLENESENNNQEEQSKDPAAETNQSKINEFKKGCFQDPSLENCASFIKFEKEIAAIYDINILTKEDKGVQVKDFDYAESIIKIDSKLINKASTTNETTEPQVQKLTNDFKISKETPEYVLNNNSTFPSLINSNIYYSPSVDSTTNTSSYSTKRTDHNFSKVIISASASPDFEIGKQFKVEDKAILATDLYNTKPDQTPILDYTGEATITRIYRLGEFTSKALESTVMSEIEPYRKSIDLAREEIAKAQKEVAEKQQQATPENTATPTE